MAICVFDEVGDVVVCQNCRQPLQVVPGLKASQYYRTCSTAVPAAPRPRASRPGLGDRAEFMLSSVGITQERWLAFKDKIGMPPNCSCDARKEWLNKVGEELGWMAKVAFSKLYPAAKYEKEIQLRKQNNSP